MSVDIAAVKHVISSLKALRMKAVKSVNKAKAARTERMNALLGEYKTEEDIQDAYGYEVITEDEHEALMAAIESRDNPDRSELSEDEIYVLEIEDLIAIATRRLRVLEWEELSPEEKEQIQRANEEFKERIKKRKENP